MLQRKHINEGSEFVETKSVCAWRTRHKTMLIFRYETQNSFHVSFINCQNDVRNMCHGYRRYSRLRKKEINAQMTLNIELVLDGFSTIIPFCHINRS